MTLLPFPAGTWMASSTIAQSSTLRQIGPSLSIVHESAIAPVRGTRPNVGRSPVVPHRVEGDEIDPSVSLPIANPTSPAAVADAGPADDPLDPWSTFHGFFVVAPNQISPCASSPLPIGIPAGPAAVADAGPADDPLDPWSTFHGFFVVAPNQISPCASS